MSRNVAVDFVAIQKELYQVLSLYLSVEMIMIAIGKRLINCSKALNT